MTAKLEKICSGCHQLKEAHEYGIRHDQGAIKLRSRCLVCESEYFRSDEYKEQRNRRQTRYRFEGRPKGEKRIKNSEYSHPTEISQENLKSRLEYDPASGNFTWKFNSEMTPTWNARFAGKPAGTLNREGYIQIKLYRLGYRAHRLAWLYIYGAWPLEEVDHINGNKIDNRISNLRQASRHENARNRGLQSNNKTGYVGVRKPRGCRRYTATIGINGQQKRLGLFDTAEEAAEAYRIAAASLHGEFAWKP